MYESDSTEPLPDTTTHECGLEQFATPISRRVYRHKACRGRTFISDDDLVRICQPYNRPDFRTYCARCKGNFAISDFAWVDTDEPISEYATRLKKAEIIPREKERAAKLAWAIILLLTTVGAVVPLFIPLKMSDVTLIVLMVAIPATILVVSQTWMRKRFPRPDYTQFK